jgi:predicted tellurium resistance membrane protein TerC
VVGLICCIGQRRRVGWVGGLVKPFGLVALAMWIRSLWSFPWLGWLGLLSWLGWPNWVDGRLDWANTTKQDHNRIQQDRLIAWK